MSTPADCRVSDTHEWFRVKTTSEIYAVAAGKIIEVNSAAAKDPSLLNSDPYGKGWLVKLEVADASAILALPNGSAYDKKHGH